MPTMEGTVQEDDYRTKVRDSDLDLNLDPGQIDGISPGKRILGIRPGLRYH